MKMGGSDWAEGLREEEDPMERGSSLHLAARNPGQRRSPRRRIDPQTVLRNLARLESPTWHHRPLEVAAETALLAGCLDAIPSLDRTREELVRTATLMVGEDYGAGFREGFDCSPATQRRTLRYVEGLDDGGVVGRAVRHAMME